MTRLPVVTSGSLRFNPSYNARKASADFENKSFLKTRKQNKDSRAEIAVATGSTGLLVVAVAMSTIITLVLYVMFVPMSGKDEYLAEVMAVVRSWFLRE